ncbi:MAG TPA: hypothetical protein VNU68_10480 [Verrucomicrobiae bacterium]|nr:hypothetical protein [Verrucomicrobiae bacterium]
MARLYLLIGWLCLAWAETLPAQSPPRCVACQSLISGKFYWLESPTVLGKQPVCENCAKLESVCAICKLPVRQNGRQLSDGRWICDRDFAAGIFEQDEALRIYESTWRDLQRILDGTLPRQNISVQLVDAVQLKKLNHVMPSEHDDRLVQGLTRTRAYTGRQFQHQIYLISGLGRSRLAAVCAHEYTHTWVQENVPLERELDHDTVEGFCELVAYKLMSERGDELEKRVILANAYTRGQVNAFVQAEAQHHFHRIVKWIKTGQDEVLPQTNSTRILALRQEAPEPLPWPPPSALPTPVPERLMLKGISGTAARPFALINDCTLTRREQGRVRAGHTSLLVFCVDVRPRSVVVRIEGVPGLTELALGDEGVAIPTFTSNARTVARTDRR